MKRSNIRDILKNYDPSYEKVRENNITTQELELNKHIDEKEYTLLQKSLRGNTDDIIHNKDITIYYFDKIRKYKKIETKEIYYIKKTKPYYTKFDDVKLTLSYEEKGNFGKLDENDAKRGN